MYTTLRTATCLLLLIGLAIPAGAQQPAGEAGTPDHDPVLAARLNADSFGMATFYAALLLSGPTRDQDAAAVAAIQQGHMRHIRAMSDSGRLLLAGPFIGDPAYRGIFVFDVATMEEARALCDADPAIRSGRLEARVIPWYASAALREVPVLHRRIQAVAFGD